MSKEQNTSGIDWVRPVNLGFTNIYFIRTEGGYILVDAGMPNKGDELDQAFITAGVDPASVELLILTHGHLDHAGSVTHAQKVTGAQVLCHRAFSDALVNGKAEPAVAQNLLGRVLNIVTGLTMGDEFEGTTPDIVIDDEYSLTEHGVAGKIIHTPGHSPASISIILDNGEALIGDLVRETRSGGISLGMFYVDKAVVFENLEKVVDSEAKTVYMSHGTDTDTATLMDFIAAAK